MAAANNVAGGRQTTRALINRLVQNRRDRTFVRITYKSDAWLLVSHAFHDISVALRKELLQRRGIGVMTAEEVIVLLWLQCGNNGTPAGGADAARLSRMQRRTVVRKAGLLVVTGDEDT